MQSVAQQAKSGGESFAALFEESLSRREMKAGEVITAEVIRVDYNFVVVNAGLKSEAYIPLDEFKNDVGQIDVKPGDFVSYYAKATDNDGVGGAKTATSDIYFVQIRPFRKDDKAAQSAGGGFGGGGGGGGQGDQVNQLSRQQQQIIAATFNIQRDQKKMKKGGSDKKKDLQAEAAERARNVADAAAQAAREAATVEVAEVAEEFFRQAQVEPPTPDEIAAFVRSYGLQAAIEHIRARTGWDFQAATQHLAQILRDRKT